MLELFKQLGLNEKEAQFYLVLLEHEALTTAELAKATEESRTNAYMIIEKLQAMRLVENDSSPVKRFNAVNPVRLQRILADRQEDLKALNAQLRSILPGLNSKYQLAHHKPGVVYRQGLEGLKESFDDMTRTGKEVLVFDSDVSVQNEEAFSVIMESLEARKKRGIKSRALLHNAGREYPGIAEWPTKRNMNVRFSGDMPYEGEVAIYGDKCAFTVYVPDIIVTTITNSVIAETMRTVFENLWEHGEE
ncbi:hypothetical protein KA047_03400 [Candidatus Saccharibacteria bacterium]|nr:hypothetical protein [Candidatus Saccharibacteria bacterium]